MNNRFNHRIAAPAALTSLAAGRSLRASWLRLLSPVMALLLAACGGGGGGSAPQAAAVSPELPAQPSAGAPTPPAPGPAAGTGAATPPGVDGASGTGASADAPHVEVGGPVEGGDPVSLEQTGPAQTEPIDLSAFDLAGYAPGIAVIPLTTPPGDTAPGPGAVGESGGTTTLPAPAAPPATQAPPATAAPPTPADPAAPAPVPANGARLYVSPLGSDSNPGTEKLPFKTIVRASRAALPGTTVYVAPGTYADGIKTTASGTATARIAYVSTTRWGARIVPPANSVNRAAWDNRGGFVDIVGFDVDGRDSRSGTKWTIGIYNGGTNASIRRNHVHHIAQNTACTGAGGSGIGVDSYFGGVLSEVDGNRVHDIGPVGCRYIQGIYMSTSGSVRNNVVYRVAEGAIHLWHDAHDVIVTNNTVTASNTGIIVGGGNYYVSKGPNDHTAVHNNIVYDNKMGISEQGATGVNNSYRNNLVYQNTIYDWQLRNGLTHSGTVSAAPMFAGDPHSETPDLTLSSASPAIGKATAAFAPDTDFDGRARNANTGFDIGAYQH